MGLMGSGFALEFRDTYRKTFLKYEKYCREEGRDTHGKFNMDILGTNVFKQEKGNLLICGITQSGVRTKQNIRPAKLEYIKACIDQMEAINQLDAPFNVIKNRVIHCPRIGCGLGGLQWKDARSLFEASCLDFNIYYLF